MSIPFLRQTLVFCLARCWNAAVILIPNRWLRICLDRPRHATKCNGGPLDSTHAWHPERLFPVRASTTYATPRRIAQSNSFSLDLIRYPCLYRLDRNWSMSTAHQNIMTSSYISILVWARRIGTHSHRESLGSCLWLRIHWASGSPT